MQDRILENATLVLPDRVQNGWLAMVDGRIAEIGEGRAPAALISVATFRAFTDRARTCWWRPTACPPPGATWPPSRRRSSRRR